jgi:hypothetical protein
VTASINFMSGPIMSPGIYRGVPSAAYHAQLTDTPSLSSSAARRLLATCPLVWWHGSYLNPQRPADEPTPAMELGSACHYAFLEPGEFAARVTVVEAADWRGKAAQDERDAARVAGRIPLLRSQVATVEAMRAAITGHAVARGAFAGGEAELTLVWRDKETGVWLKGRPDYLGPNAAWLADLKTTTNAEPAAFGRHAYDMSYHAQAAWYLDGLRALTGAAPSALWFIAVERDAPHAVTVAAFDEDAIEAGRVLNRRAVRLFARCLERGDWPGYRHVDTPDRDRAFVLELPAWARTQIANLLTAE